MQYVNNKAAKNNIPRFLTIDYVQLYAALLIRQPSPLGKVARLDATDEEDGIMLHIIQCTKTHYTTSRRAW